MPERSQYNFWGALRVFSLAVALVSCGLGIRLGWDMANPQYALAVLLLLGGVLAQAGMNLINDTEDLSSTNANRLSEAAKKRIARNQKLGWVAFALAGCRHRAIPCQPQGLATFRDIPGLGATGA